MQYANDIASAAHVEVKRQRDQQKHAHAMTLHECLTVLQTERWGTASYVGQHCGNPR